MASRRAILSLSLCLGFVISGSTASGYGKLATVVKKTYGLGSVSCVVCHVKGQKKRVLNPFGRLIRKLLEERHLAKRFAEAKKIREFDRKERVYAELQKEFRAALGELDKLKTPSGMSYADALRAGRIAGTRLRKHR